LSGSNTVFTDDIVNNAVWSKDVRDDALTGGGLAAADLRPNSVGGSEVRNGSLGTVEQGTVPAARATSTAIQVTQDEVETTISLNSEVFDTANIHQNATNNSRLTAPVSGIYQINARVKWSFDGGGAYRRLSIRRNGDGGDYIAEDNRTRTIDEDLRQNLSTLATLDAGEYIELRVRQDTGTTLPILPAAGIAPELSMYWVGPKD
jgi:hypothetical protein